MSTTITTMRVDVFRHGHTEGQKDRGVYADVGDIFNPLDKLGQEQAAMLAGFLPHHLKSEGIRKMPMVYIGNRLRVEDTFRPVKYAMEESGFFEGDMVVRPESRFNEKFFGLTNFFQNLNGATREQQVIADFLDDLSKVLHAQDPHRFTHLGGESHVILYQRVVSALRGALFDARLAGYNHIMIPTSGAVMQCIQQRMGRSSSQGISNPGNCDLHTYIGAGDKWSMYKVYDGETMTPERSELKAEPLTFDPLDDSEKQATRSALNYFAVPEHLRSGFTEMILNHFVDAQTDPTYEARAMVLQEAFKLSGGTKGQYRSLCNHAYRQLAKINLEM